MKLYDIIFTKQMPQKYRRHILFWSSWLLFCIMNYILNTSFQKWLSPVGIYEMSRVPILNTLLEIAFIYPLVYFIIPKLLLYHKRWLFLIIPFYIILCFIPYYL